MREPLTHRLRRWAHEIPHRVFMPRKWMVMNNPYDYQWDAFLTTALDLGMVKPEHPWFREAPTVEHTMACGTYRVWVANYPYGYAICFGKEQVDTPPPPFKLHYRPSFRAMLRLRKLQLQLAREIEKE